MAWWRISDRPLSGPMLICGTWGWWINTTHDNHSASRCSAIWNSKAFTRHVVPIIKFNMLLSFDVSWVICCLKHISLYIKLGHIQIGWPGLTWAKNNGLSCRTVFSQHQLINRNIRSSSWEATVFSPIVCCTIGEWCHSCRNAFFSLY